MAKRVVLVTGASGELGRALLRTLAARGGDHEVVAVDLAPLPDDVRPLVHASYSGNILDRALFDWLAARYAIERVFHLAALLSARGEFAPELAHQVNVEGTLNVLCMAQNESSRQERPVRVLFPSSIAVYGMPPQEKQGPPIELREEQWNSPITMYGCNKLYCEHLGRYFSFHGRQSLSPGSAHLDFRAIRLPGLLSADTVPAGGTSDFGPEMIHAAARGIPYECFVPPEAKIPFMAMPDAVRALIELADADGLRLSSSVYNIAAFSISAGEIARRLGETFAGAKVAFVPEPTRSEIVASWPEAVDDGRARSDWGWRPAYDWGRTFCEYLVPSVTARYSTGSRAP